MEKKEMISDGAYMNAVTGMGTLAMDKSEHVKAAPYVPADQRELARMAVADGLAARIVKSVPEAALKQPVTVAGDMDGKVLKECTRAGLFRALRAAGEAERLTGGAVCVAEYGDSDPSQPAPNAGKITGWRTYSAASVNMLSGDFEGDSPKVFRVRRLDGVEVPVDASRCTVFRGSPLPDALGLADVREAFFGVSELRPCEGALKDLAAAYASISEMLQETGLSVFRFDGLDRMLSKPGCGIDDLQKLMSTVKFGMGTMRAVYLGAGDSFETKAHSFAGLPETLKELESRVSASCGIPLSILFGQSATGLAQTNSGDLRAWQSLVESWREAVLYVPACRMLADFTRRNLGKEVSEFDWGAVAPMTETERNDAMAKQADYLVKYIQCGVLTPDEVRTSVFANGHSFDVSVEA